MKCRLALSLLEVDCRCLEDRIGEFEKGGIEILHIDIMDGQFVPNIGIGLKEISGLRKITDMTFDVHMMVREPSHLLRAVADAGADLITIHYEATDRVNETLHEIKALGKKSGLALNPDTDLRVLDEINMTDVDVIHIMTIFPGVAGQKFIKGSEQKIRNLRKRLSREGQKKLIEVDGGITLDNLNSVVAAGTDIVVSGRALTSGDVFENIVNMQNIINTTGDEVHI